MQNYIETYAEFLKKYFDIKQPIRVVCDASNGTTSIVLEKLTDIPNLSITLINNTPDGDFPAHGPNPLEEGAIDQLAQAVLAEKADFGVAFDADGDRAFFVDETGKMLQSFMTCILLFKNNKPPFIGDELVYQALKHVNLYTDEDLKATKIGSRFVKEAIKEFNASTGGEFSGHFYFEKFFGLDSGIFAFIEVANAVSAMDQTLSEFFASIQPHEQVNDSIKTEGKNTQELLNTIEAAYQTKATIKKLDGITLDMGQSWVSIRASNTEPIIRLISGAPTLAEAQKLVADIKALI
jgi:phosphomannomutase